MNEERKIETEEVNAVAPPPRARMTPEFERKKDYLAGFLAGETTDDHEGGPGGDLQAAVVEVLKSVYDPEIPVNIVDLGLIYDCKMEPIPATSNSYRVDVKMTLTAPGCGWDPSRRARGPARQSPLYLTTTVIFMLGWIVQTSW